MWLINSMVELGESQNVIQVCIDHKVVSLISELIQHSHSLRVRFCSFYINRPYFNH